MATRFWNGCWRSKRATGACAGFRGCKTPSRPFPPCPNVARWHWRMPPSRSGCASSSMAASPMSTALDWFPRSHFCGSVTISLLKRKARLAPGLIDDAGTFILSVTTIVVFISCQIYSYRHFALIRLNLRVWPCTARLYFRRKERQLRPMKWLCFFERASGANWLRLAESK